MPPHIVLRGSTWYLIDGRKHRVSLKTNKKGVAELELKKYYQGKLGIKKSPTVKEYYDTWIQSQIPPMVRKSATRDYRQHFTTYILPTFQRQQLSAFSTATLRDFRIQLLKLPLSIKTARNIIDSSFRAMWRDAKNENLVQHNPFADLEWPRRIKPKPQPFTAEERDKILVYFRDHEPFYYPFVLVCFVTGMRPSEASALKWDDCDLDAMQIHIRRSRHLKTDGPPKTEDSARSITISKELSAILKALPSMLHGRERVFVNKFGNPLDPNQFAKDYWARTLLTLGIPHRKFYNYKHTFITEALKRLEPAEAIADYCGTSEQMIKDNYRGPLVLSHATVLPQLPERAIINQVDSVASPTGFEPVVSDVPRGALVSVRAISMREYEKSRSKKRA